MTGSWVTLRQSCQRLGGVDIVLLIQIKQSASEGTHRVPAGAAPLGRKLFLRVINGLDLVQAPLLRIQPLPLPIKTLATTDGGSRKRR